MTEGSAQVEPTAPGAAIGAVRARAGERASLVAFALALAVAFGIWSPVLYWLGINWYEDENYSHGFLIVPLALYFAWERRDELRDARIDPSWWGLVPLVLSVATLTVGRLAAEYMNTRLSFVFALNGLVLLLLGREVFRVLVFPLLFLFLMIPLPQSILNVVAFPLQLIAADFAVDALYWLGIPALREGNIIHLANTQLFVAEACSGLRSLMALVTLAVVFAYFFRHSVVERVILVVSSIPIAIFVNSFRVALTGVLTHSVGEEAAGGWIHETQGLFTFGIAFLLLLVEARVLQWVIPESWRGAPDEEVPA